MVTFPLSMVVKYGNPFMSMAFELPVPSAMLGFLLQMVGTCLDSLQLVLLNSDKLVFHVSEELCV